MHVGRRAADDAQHFSGSGLLLQRLPQLGIALLQLLEKAHVLDGDHCLVRERLDQPDLPLGEGADFSTAEVKTADLSSLVEEARQ